MSIHPNNHNFINKLKSNKLSDSSSSNSSSTDSSSNSSFSSCRVDPCLRGPEGLRGLTVTGPIGPMGPPGAPGAPGGPTGSTGIPGILGITGFQGFQGVGGPLGSSGSDGSTGITGFPGSTGPTGSTGDTGATGQVGFTGIAPVGPVGQPGFIAPMSGVEFANFPLSTSQTSAGATSLTSNPGSVFAYELTPISVFGPDSILFILLNYPTGGPATPSENNGHMISMPAGAYIIDYETSLGITGPPGTTGASIAIYTTAGSPGIPTNLIYYPRSSTSNFFFNNLVHSTTKSSWLHGRVIITDLINDPILFAVGAGVNETVITTNPDTFIVDDQYLIRVTILKCI
jgi:hypothetical protein